MPLKCQSGKGLLSRTEHLAVSLVVGQQPYGTLQLWVVIECAHYATLLIVVCRYDALLQHVAYYGAVVVEFSCQVVLQLGLQCVKLSLGIILIALELSHLYQFVIQFVCLAVIFESGIDNPLLEVCVLGIG